MSFLLKFFGGNVYGYLIGGAIISLLSIGATSYIVTNIKDVEIDDLKAQAAEQKSANVSAALSQLQGFINGIHLSEVNFQNTLDSINGNFSTLKGQLANVSKQKPLPVDCVIDSERLLILTAATAAANKPAASAAH